MTSRQFGGWKQVTTLICLICTARSPGNEEKVREIKEAGWGGEKLKNFGSGKIIGLLLEQIWGKQERSCGDSLHCSERKSVRPRYHGDKISG